MSDADKKVECQTHGSASATFICQHLSSGDQLGFHVGYDPENPNDLYPDAWCDRCDAVLEKEGEWNDVSEAFADIRMVCAGCYGDIRQRNWLEDPEAFKQLVTSSFDYLQQQQASLKETYQVGDYERWDWYQEKGQLVFSHEGKEVLICDIDFVGSLSTASDTWMWAWANTSFTENIKAKAAFIRQMGEESNLLKLACPIWGGDEVDGWEMTAIMAKAVDAIGAYRTPTDNGYVYMVITKATWV